MQIIRRVAVTAAVCVVIVLITVGISITLVAVANGEPNYWEGYPFSQLASNNNSSGQTPTNPIWYLVAFVAICASIFLFIFIFAWISDIWQHYHR